MKGNDIRNTVLPIRPDAAWTDKTCPKCDHYFVAKDQNGFYCCMDGCGWTEPYDDIEAQADATYERLTGKDEKK